MYIDVSFRFSVIRRTFEVYAIFSPQSRVFVSFEQKEKKINKKTSG